MSSVDLGSKYTAEWKTRPEAATLTAEVIRPDGTAGTAAIDQVRGTATITADMAGRWRISWGSDAGIVYTDIFDVWPEDPRFLISIDDALTALGASRANDEYIDDLRLYIAAATPVIEDITGPVIARTVTGNFSAGQSLIVLPGATSHVVSVFVDGQEFTTWSEEHGILFAGPQQSRTLFPGTTVTVTWQEGFPVVPANIRLAARELVRHWVQIGKQYAGGSGVRVDPTDEVFTPSGFAVPRRVVELCAPNTQIGGFA
ncbi:hypothetical protein [Glutamicibacter sp.]|uniref:hypothetical protein n=1 Tax=Glutamicibacter sp. TaxID=1931995 RepID=UPI0028BE1725|nr:hypothetical protein [Glutamicibacter sp.]